MPYPRCQTKLQTYHWINLSSDKILKVGQNIKFQVEAKSYVQKIITEVLVLYTITKACSESSQTSEMESPIKKVHN